MTAIREMTATFRGRKTMRRLFLLFVATLLLGGCVRLPARWDVLDLRLLDPADDAPAPHSDIIALYTRLDGAGRQVRVDFLDLADQPPERVYLAFDNAPGGSSRLPGTDIATDIEWDVLVSVPTPDTAQILLPDETLPSPGLVVGASYNYPQDYLTASLPPELLTTEFRFQAFALSPSGLADSTVPVSSSAQPPARAPLLLSFSDAFPAVLPAQALRRWDGAHTGPYGERHGLHPLLEAAQKHHIPLTLLDLRLPASLSALDIVGGLAQVRQMQSEGFLTIPSVGSDLDADTSLSQSRSVAERFGLAPGDLLYMLTGSSQPDYRIQFASLADPSHVAREGSLGLTILPVSAGGEQITPDGPTLATRRALLACALTADPADLLSLGGSLPSSAWGDSDAAEAAMVYIAQHPWIRPLSPEAARAFSPVEIHYPPDRPSPGTYARYTSTGTSAGLDSQTLAAKLRLGLLDAPPGPLTDSAWEMFFTLAAPSDDPNRESLQAQYLGEVGVILAASDWAQAVAPRATCDVDLDYDGLDECVLANDTLFAVFERDGGRLAYLFSMAENGPHQLIGGTEQFVAGLSDPSLWHVERGPAADPEQTPGAFVDADAPWSLYEVSTLRPDSLTLTSADGKRAKSFRLLPDAVSAEYSLEAPLSGKFALTLDPWLRFHRGWGSGYYVRLRDGGAIWSVRGGPSISITAPGQIGFAAFNDSMDWLYGPEDPNQDFLPGHYLPFPMAVAEFEVGDGANFVVQVK